VTAPELISAVAPVAACFEALGVRYYVTGSLASSAHGIARASLDIDLVAELDPEHADGFVRCLGSAYYIPVDSLRLAVAERRSFNLIHLATMFKVDVFVSPRRPFDREAAKRARVEALDADADAPGLPIATAEDTVLAKLEWFRRGGETSERQWWDIVGILKVGRGADRAHLEKWAAALGVSDLLQRALAQAEENL
jgi:hypothetical protein